MSWNILHGNSLEVLKTLPENSVHCVVTSPPYWGLRDYGIEPSVWGGEANCVHEFLDCGKSRWHPDRPTGDKDFNGSGRFVNGDRLAQGSKVARGEVLSFGNICQLCGAWRGCFGLEPTPEMYVEHAVWIFREVRRVLRPEGTLWLNLGDCYVTKPFYDGDTVDPKWAQARNRGRNNGPNRQPIDGLKPKDLVGIPWRVAFALQADGWWLRQDIIWSKANPMPESVRDRCSKSHEYVFLMTKSERYFYDYAAVMEDTTGNAHGRGDGVNPKCAEPGSGIKQNTSFSAAVAGLVSKRNRRSVWSIATKPFPEAHFATFPPELPEVCVKAGTSDRGCCPECGAPFERVVETVKVNEKEVDNPLKGRLEGTHGTLGHDGQGMRFESVYTTEVVTKGWKPTCDHFGDEIADSFSTSVPCTVLDPFNGAGTTGLVTKRLFRNYIGIDLNEKYIAMASERIWGDAPLLNGEKWG
jgi:DNA modification methylase